MRRSFPLRVPSGVPGWVLRPVLPAVLLAAAVAVSVATGQPLPASPASGVSVPVSVASDAPSGLGDLLLVSAGTLTRFNVETGTVTPIPMPRGQVALRAWPMRGADVVLTESVPPGAGAALPVPAGTAAPAPMPPPAEETTPGGHTGTPTADSSAAEGTAEPPTWVYAIPRAGAPVRLGAATAVVPSPDGGGVWLLRGDRATLVGLDGTVTGTGVQVPAGYRLVGATRRGLIASVGGAAPLTVLLPADGGLPHWLANAEGLDVAGGVLLMHSEHRIGWVRLDTGEPHWLPGLSAVRITGPGALSPDRKWFAVQARVNDHARLVVGPMNAGSSGDLRVVALEGGTVRDRPSAPVWARDGRVLAVRPDGRMVVYRPGDVRASVLGPQYQASGVATVAPADRDLPH